MAGSSSDYHHDRGVHIYLGGRMMYKNGYGQNSPLLILGRKVKEVA